MLKNTNSLGM